MWMYEDVDVCNAYITQNEINFNGRDENVAKLNLILLFINNSKQLTEEQTGPRAVSHFYPAVETSAPRHRSATQ